MIAPAIHFGVPVQHPIGGRIDTLPVCGGRKLVTTNTDLTNDVKAVTCKGCLHVLITESGQQLVIMAKTLMGIEKLEASAIERVKALEF